MKKLAILETDNFSPEVIRLLKNYFHVDLNNNLSIKKALEEYDIVWFRLGHQIKKGDLKGSIKTKYIVTPVTGLTHIDTEAAEKKGISIISLKGEFEFLKEVRATAEHTLGLALSLLRKIPFAFQSVLQGKWDRDLFRGAEIYKKTVGIVGMGRLGQIVAEYFNAMGASIIYYDRNKKIKIPLYTQAPDMDFLLERSDIVSLHISFEKENIGFFSVNYFSKMKTSAFFINTSRGELVDEKALLDVLVNRKIAGAALDVIRDEFSFTGTHPLIKYARHHDNLILTPHIGGNTFESFEKTEMFIAKKLIKEIYGE